MSVSSLETTIHSILRAPETDLKTISAKRVRKLIPELRSDISPDFVKANKEEINELIEKIYGALVEANKLGQEYKSEEPILTNSKRKREDTPEEDEEENPDYDSQDDEEGDRDHDSKPAVRASKSRSSELADEAYARQLSSELNQRPSRTGRNTVKAKKSSTKASKAKKSRSQISDSEEDEKEVNGDTKKAARLKKKRNGTGEAKGGFAKEFALSEPLSVVVGTNQLSRPQVVKRLWEYIKARQLQNPDNKKEIFCDDSLKNLFSTDKINMFTMNKVLSNHLYELEQP